MFYIENWLINSLNIDVDDFFKSLLLYAIYHKVWMASSMNHLQATSKWR